MSFTNTTFIHDTCSYNNKEIAILLKLEPAESAIKFCIYLLKINSDVKASIST